MPNLSGTPQAFVGDTSAVDTSALEKVGKRAWDASGNEYIYLKGVASTAAGSWVVFDEDYATTLLTANEVGPVAIAMAAVDATTKFGWYQIFGVNTIAKTDTVAADSSLYIDGTAGRADDLGVSGDLILNAYSMTADTSNVATVWIGYPSVSNDVGGGGAVTGPASSTDNAIARWNGTGGTILQNSGITISDTDLMAGGEWQGTAVVVLYGGTGATTASGARTNLGLVIGTNVQAWDAQLDDIAALAVTDSNFIVGNGTNWVVETGATARTSLGLAIGTNVQAWDAQLDDIAGLAVTDSNFIVGNGTNWVAETGATVRTSLGLGTGDSPQFTGIELGHATDTTITRASAGNLNVEGNLIYRVGGTDVSLADGGTGQSLVDPGDDRIMFWDDSVGRVDWLDEGNGLTISGTTLVVDSASDTVDGIVELATAAETTTGTDAIRAVTPDGLAGSDYGKRVVGVLAIDPATTMTTGSAKVYYRIPAIMNGWNLVAVAAQMFGTGTTSVATIQVRNVTDAVNMLSTGITIDSAEKDSSTAATAPVINAATDDVATADQIAIDVNGIHTTAGAGLYVEMVYQLP